MTFAINSRLTLTTIIVPSKKRAVGRLGKDSVRLKSIARQRTSFLSGLGGCFFLGDLVGKCEQWVQSWFATKRGWNPTQFFRDSNNSFCLMGTIFLGENFVGEITSIGPLAFSKWMNGIGCTSGGWMFISLVLGEWPPPFLWYWKGYVWLVDVGYWKVNKTTSAIFFFGWVSLGWKRNTFLGKRPLLWIFGSTFHPGCQPQMKV